MNIIDLLIILGKLALAFLDKQVQAKMKDDQYDIQLKQNMGHALLTGNRTAVLECIDKLRNKTTAS